MYQMIRHIDESYSLQDLIFYNQTIALILLN